MVGVPYNPNNCIFITSQALNADQFNPNVPDVVSTHNMLWDTIAGSLIWVDTETNLIVLEIAGGAGSLPFGNDTGIVNAYQTVIPNATLTDGYVFELQIANTNTGASTLQINALGVLPVVDSDGNPIAAGMLGADSLYILAYNSTFNAYQLLGDARPTNLPITLNVIPKGNGTSIIDGSWSFSLNDIIPNVSGSNIGDATHRIGTVFMASNIDYANNLIWKSGGVDYMTLTTAGDLGVGVVPTARLHAKGIGNTTGTLGLQVESLNGNAWFRVYDDGTLWSQGLANNSHLFNVLAGNLSFTLDAPGIQYFEFKTGGVIQSQLINQTNLTRFAQAANQFWGVYGSDNNPYILFDETNKNVGIGLLAPGARLHVKGVNTLAGSYTAKFENSAANLYSIEDNGANIWNSYFDGQGSGIPNFMYNTDTGGIFNQYNSVNGVKWAFNEGINNRGSFSNNGGYAQLISQFRFTLKNYANISKLWMDDGNGYIGIGSDYFAASAQLHVTGASATSADYALKVDDLAGNRILHSRNDGKTFIGPRFCYVSSSNVVSGGEFNLFAEQLFLLDSLVGSVIIEAHNQPLVFNTWHGGPSNNEVTFAGRGAAGFESFVRTYDVSTTEDGFKTYIGSSSASGDTNFKHCFVNGNVHIGYDELVNSDTTKLTIRSRNALHTQNNLLLQDDTTATLLKVRNDGSINAPLIPTSGTGFPPAGTVAGDLWVDTLTMTVKIV